MVLLVGTWAVFFLAMILSIKLLIEMFQDARNCFLLASPVTNIGRVTHLSWGWFSVIALALSWAAFGFLCCL